MGIEDRKDELSRRRFLRNGLAAGAVAAVKPLEAKAAQGAPLFGLEAVPIQRLEDTTMKAFVMRNNWIEALSKIRDCEAEYKEGTSVGAKKMASIIADAAEQEGWTKFGSVNRAVNEAIVLQTKEQEKRDELTEWPSPLEVFDGQPRDCKSSVSAKYFALRKLNVPENERCVVVVDTMRQNPLRPGLTFLHTVVGVRSNGEWKLLDNWSNFLVADRDFFTQRKHDWKPLYILNENGAREFVKHTASSR